MLLAIDVGNTQTVIGLFGDDAEADAAVPTASGPCEEGLLDHWRIATLPDRTADEQALVIQEFLGFHGFSFDEEVDGLVISSVVPRCTAAFREMTERYFGFRPVVIEPGVKTGLPVLTDNPREVGADRIANAVAAVDIYGGADGRASTSAPPPPTTRCRRRASCSGAPSRRASTSASTRSTSAPTRCAGSSCSSRAA